MSASQAGATIQVGDHVALQPIGGEWVVLRITDLGTYLLQSASGGARALAPRAQLTLVEKGAS